MRSEERIPVPGDFVVITRNVSGHGYEIRETVQIERTSGSDTNYVGRKRPGMKRGCYFTVNECTKITSKKNLHFVSVLSSKEEHIK